jgi:hypothetical protein
LTSSQKYVIIKLRKIKGGIIMNNLEFIKAFASGKSSGNYSNLHIMGNKLVNYETVIAERIEGGISLNIRRYSRSTSIIQNLIKLNTNVVDEFIGKPAIF